MLHFAAKAYILRHRVCGTTPSRTHFPGKTRASRGPSRCTEQRSTASRLLWVARPTLVGDLPVLVVVAHTRRPRAGPRYAAVRLIVSARHRG